MSDPNLITLGHDQAAFQAAERRRMWALIGPLLAAGHSTREVESLTGFDHVRIARLSREVRDLGEGAFTVRTIARKSSEWSDLVAKDSPAGAKLMELYLATIGAGSANMVDRRSARMATALRCFASEPECPPELAARLREGRFPIVLQRFLRTITPELENRMRGGKHYQLHGTVSRRDRTLRFPDGTRADAPAGFRFVFDDMSSNQPFWAQVGGELMISRQGLYAIDSRSMRWLGKMLVARPREAYRSEDILRFLRQLFAETGKPDEIVFECGVWRARKIRGWSLAGECEAVRPAMEETGKNDLEEGLRAIGVRLVFATSARGKVIEGAFNHLQSVLAIKARDFVNIGRHAGEFDAGAKRMRQVRAESHTPAMLGFAPMAELSERIDQAFAQINGDRNSRGEVPDQVWSRDTGARALRQLAADDEAVFLPDRRDRVIQGGRVTLTIDGRPHDYRCPWMIEVGSGFRVVVRFDSTEPTRGIALYNREDGPANTRGWRLGQFLGFAPWECPAPMSDVLRLEVRGVQPRELTEFYGPGAIDRGDTHRKEQNRRVATVFSALPRPGQPAVKRAESRGDGRVVTVEQNTQTSTSKPAAELPSARALQPLGRGAAEIVLRERKPALVEPEW
jgi:hypothetical protein